MNDKLTPEKLNDLPKDDLIRLTLTLQDQLSQVNARLDNLTEQIALAVVVLPTNDVSEEDRIREFGSLDNCRRMEDAVYRRLIYIPAGWKVEEAHVAVYCSRIQTAAARCHRE